MQQKCPGKPAPACAMFIYKSKTGVLIHAKSCTHQSYCGSNGTFCKDILLGGSDCRLECCDGELCNIKETFKPTTPPVTTAPTEGPTTVETKTTLPTHETTAPDYDDDDDDCSWIDAGSTHLISGILLFACALCGLISRLWETHRSYLVSGWLVAVFVLVLIVTAVVAVDVALRYVTRNVSFFTAELNQMLKLWFETFIQMFSP